MLSVRQSLFVEKYLVLRNAKQAALESGYSPRTATEQGHRLLKHPEVRKRIAAHQRKIKMKTEVTTERIVMELARIAFADLTDLISVEGDDLKIKNLSEVDADLRAAVSEVSITSTRDGKNRKIKLHDKIKALQLLGLHTGMFVTVEQLIDRMSETELDRLTERLLTKVKQNKNTQDDEDENENPPAA
jgi:phage terminase small subunit